MHTSDPLFEDSSQTTAAGNEDEPVAQRADNLWPHVEADVRRDINSEDLPVNSDRVEVESFSSHSNSVAQCVSKTIQNTTLTDHLQAHTLDNAW